MAEKRVKVKIDDLDSFSKLNAAMFLHTYPRLDIVKNTDPGKQDRGVMCEYSFVSDNSTRGLLHNTIMGSETLSAAVNSLKMNVYHDGNTPKMWTSSCMRLGTMYTSTSHDVETCVFKTYLKYNHNTEYMEIPEWMK